MHYCVGELSNFSAFWIYKTIVHVVFDITVSYLFFSLITLFRYKRLALSLLWTFWVITDLTNIVYSRYFNQYFDLNSIQEISNLKEGWTEYIATSYRISDVFIILTSILFWSIILKIDTKGQSMMKDFKVVIIVLICTMIPHAIASDIIDISRKRFPTSISEYWSKTQGLKFYYAYSIEQKHNTCAFGLLRTEFYFYFTNTSNKRTLSDDEEQTIDAYIRDKADAKEDLISNYAPIENKNIIFIIVESYLSAVSDLSVDGIEITPVLNKLRHDENTYYNGNIVSNIACGESSDAQICLFTGLLPLCNGITVNNLLDSKPNGFPALLRDSLGYETYMTIPTQTNFWHQDEINRIYGFNHLTTSLKPNSKFLGNDETLFLQAFKEEQDMKTPFFHVILTATMHSPYYELKSEITAPINGIHTWPENYSLEYKNYLLACHYTDTQIGAFIDSLKANQQFSNSTIIITGDHQAHSNFLKMESHQINEEKIPIYIINGNIPSEVTTTTINQIDLFPTFLDIFGIKSKWRGIGNSILRSSYDSQNAIITEKDQNISNLIILGNYNTSAN